MSPDPTEADKRVVIQVAIEASRSSTTTTVVASWVFPGEKLCVGRSSTQADLVFKSDPSMSKRHFEIQFDGEVCRLVDLGSANRTFVNGKRVESSCELVDGDEVCAGKTVFKVGIMGEDDELEPLQPTCDSSSADQVSFGLEEPSTIIGKSGLEDTVLATGGLPGVATLRLKTDSVSDADPEQMTRVLAWIRRGQGIIVGSSGFDSDWCVPADWDVAARHFRVSYDGVSCSVCTCDAGAITSVNDKPIGDSDMTVVDGDLIRAGSALFVVQLSE